MKNNSIFIIVLLLALSACKPALNAQLTFDEVMNLRSPQAKQLEMAADSLNCKKNSHHGHGQYQIMNNLWGEDNLKRDSAYLCTYSKSDLFGWKWSVPNHAKGVIGYPSLRIGPGPWSEKGKINDLPRKVSSIQELQVTYDTEIYTKHKTYNLAFDIWLNASIPIHKDNITTEIMVWEDYYDFKPYGKKVNEFKTTFGTYDLMQGYLKDDTWHQDWQYYAFVRQKPRKQGTVDLKVFIDYLVKEHDLNPNDFISSIEFGNEIGDSSGFTLVNEYDFTIK